MNKPSPRLLCNHYILLLIAVISALVFSNISALETLQCESCHQELVNKPAAAMIFGYNPSYYRPSSFVEQLNVSNRSYPQHMLSASSAAKPNYMPTIQCKAFRISLLLDTIRRFFLAVILTPCAGTRQNITPIESQKVTLKHELSRTGVRLDQKVISSLEARVDLVSPCICFS